MIKVGLIARAENRGLGHICWEASRHLPFDRVLGVDMGEWARGFPPHKDRYPPETTWVEFDGYAPYPFPLDTVAEWMDGLDAIYTAETLYDWRIAQLADVAGCRTILHTMPEFHRRPDFDACSEVWLPTPWRAEQHPDALLMPVPVALDRYQPSDMAAASGGILRVLHTAGHRAAMDRNGTLLFADALRWVTRPMHVTITTQDVDVIHPVAVPSFVTVDVRVEQVGDYWSNYAGHHVLVMPRRYGGLSLPCQEAMGAGLAVIMPGVSPNEWWPTIRIPAGRHAEIQTGAGPIPTYMIDPRELARTLDRLAADPAEVCYHQAQSRAWAEAHSWDALADEWRATLGGSSNVPVVLAERSAAPG